MIRKKSQKIFGMIQIVWILLFLTGCAGEISNNAEMSQKNEVEESLVSEANVWANDSEVELLDEKSLKSLENEKEGKDAEVPFESSTETSTSIPTENTLEMATEEPIEQPTEVATEIPKFSVEIISETLYPNRTLNVRTGPSIDYNRIGSVYVNQEINVTGVTENGWYEIDYDGQKGYCSGYYLETSPVSVSVSEAPETDEHALITEDLQTPTEEPTIVSTETPVVTEPITVSATVNELFAAVNADRAANGIPALVLDTGLLNTAALRAEETSILFDHTRPDGTTCFTAFPAESGASKAENIYMISVATTAEAVEAAWMASAGHQANILNAKYTKIGIGIYQASNGYWYFVQDFSN